MGDMADDFRALRAATKARREHRESKEEAALARVVAGGLLDARQLSEYHWRCWLPEKLERTADFWPRSGLTRIDGRNSAGGVLNLLKQLREPVHG